jgi:DNA-binding response OmpR family regulator
MNKKTILLIEDDQSFARLLAMQLIANDYRVNTAQDVYEATKEAQREKPDLVILDIGLPLVDGFVVIDKLKAMYPVRQIPFIVLSGQGPETVKQQAVRTDAFALMQKPPDNAELLATIRRALG